MPSLMTPSVSGLHMTNGRLSDKKQMSPTLLFAGEDKNDHLGSCYQLTHCELMYILFHIETRIITIWTR